MCGEDRLMQDAGWTEIFPGTAASVDIKYKLPVTVAVATTQATSASVSVIALKLFDDGRNTRSLTSLEAILVLLLRILTSRMVSLLPCTHSYSASIAAIRSPRRSPMQNPIAAAERDEIGAGKEHKHRHRHR